MMFAFSAQFGLIAASTLLLSTQAFSQESSDTARINESVELKSGEDAASLAHSTVGQPYRLAASYNPEDAIFTTNRILRSRSVSLGLHKAPSDSSSLYLTGSFLPDGGKTYRLGVGLEYFATLSWWQPSIGAEAALIVGQSISFRKNTGSLSETFFASASAALKLAPVRFINSDRDKISLFSLTCGPVFFDGPVGLHATLSLLEIETKI